MAARRNTTSKPQPTDEFTVTKVKEFITFLNNTPGLVFADGSKFTVEDYDDESDRVPVGTLQIKGGIWYFTPVTV